MLSTKNGLYDWEGGHKFLAPDDQWILIQDVQVSFIEAVKAYSRKKDIYCLINGEKHKYCDDSIPNKWETLKDENDQPISITEILAGVWYIMG